MIYGFSSLFSLLLFGSNQFEGFSVWRLCSDFMNFLGGFIYWFGGHIFGTEQFYNSLSAHPEYLSDFNAWSQSVNLVPFNSFICLLLGLIASIIVTWGLVRLIVKVCSIGKITY